MKAKLVPFDEVYSPEITHIRTEVFVKEQGIDSKIDFDGLDGVATHVLVVSRGESVGTGRILNDGHIGRIAVLKSARKQGVGAMVLEALVGEAKKRHYNRVYLGSQMHATVFYEKLGFHVCGEIFMDAGLEHVEMEMFLG
ncbi:MAG: GNAT family N-acetyltransferase [Cocleimonas sp.]